MNTPFPPPGRVDLDVSTVAVVLYLSPFTRRDWTRIGPAGLARFVTRVVTDPRCRAAEMVALVLAAEQAGQIGQPEFLTAARRYARRVVAALSN